MRRSFLAFLAPAIALLLTAPAPLPHDTWLLALAGEAGSVTLSVRVGMDFPESVNAIPADRLVGAVRRPDGEVTAIQEWRSATENDATEAVLGSLQKGLHVAWVDTQPRMLELAARKFNDYLLHDGLWPVLAGRFDRGDESRDAKERYRKCAKAIFQTATGSTTGFDRPTGQRLEIIPLENPLTAKPRDTLRVRVVFDGQSLVRALLCWDHPGNGEDFTGSAFTDSNGEAIVPVTRSGLTTLRLVHMTRPNTEEFEWESFWGSLTFEVR